MPPLLISKISLKIIYLKFNSNLPGANELTDWGLVMPIWISELGCKLSRSYEERSRWLRNIPGAGCIAVTLRLRQNGCHFAAAIFKWIFLNKNVKILIEISLKFVPKHSSNKILVSDNGLRPSRWQAIIWTNDGEIINTYMRYSASMS